MMSKFISFYCSVLEAFFSVVLFTGGSTHKLSHCLLSV